MAASGDWARLQRTGGSGAARGAGREDAVLESLRRDAAFFEARSRIKRWVRARFALTDDEAVSVSEVASALPGCPPLETVVEFRTADGMRHHFKVFKALPCVAEDDLPPAWLSDALAMPEGYECDCC